jgi:hypothetical protein
MNENFKKVMDAIAEMKSMFSTSTEEVTETSFGEGVLMDGTAIAYEGELAVGTQVFVVADGEQIPAPEGTHALGGEFEGVSIVTDASGVVVEIIDERAAEGEAASSDFEAIDSEEIPAALEKATEVLAAQLGLEMGQAYDLATAVIAAINENNAAPVAAESMSAEQVESIVSTKMEAFSKVVESLGEMIQTIVSDNETLRTEMSAMKSEFDAFKAAPSNGTTEGEKFSRVTSNLTARQIFLKSQINK